MTGKDLYCIAKPKLGSKLTGDGPYTTCCHSWLEERLACAKALLPHTCTAALEERQQVIDALKAEGIHPVFHYVPLHDSPAGRRYGRVAGAMTHTDDLSARLLRLPLWVPMQSQHVDRVVGALKSAVFAARA